MNIQNRWLTRTISFFLAVLLRTLYATCRVEAVETVPGTSPYRQLPAAEPQRFLYCIWHDILLMAIFSGRPQHMAGLVSRHQDGGFLADAMEVLGITPIRGSSKRGGMQALKQCLDAAKTCHVSVTPDGPRGPRHQIKEGIIFMASVTGRQIVPISASCRRFWRIQGSWTDMLIPAPFTRILIQAGEPLSVPAQITRDEIPQYIAELEARMAALTSHVEQVMHPELASTEDLHETEQSDPRQHAA